MGIEEGGYMYVSRLGSDGGITAGSWISSEVSIHIDKEWRGYTSLHLISQGARARRLWAILLDGYSVLSRRKDRYGIKFA